jgi:hypothetical protein
MNWICSRERAPSQPRENLPSRAVPQEAHSRRTTSSASEQTGQRVGRRGGGFLFWFIISELLNQTSIKSILKLILLMEIKFINPSKGMLLAKRLPDQ